MIVAIEGIDASGKETQVQRLWKWAISNSDELGLEDVHTQDFPDYKNETGGVIQDILTGKCSIAMEDKKQAVEVKALVMQSLMVTNRLEHGSVLHAYAKNPSSLLILDRYSPSAMVYGGADGLGPAFLSAIHRLIPDPDICILIDIPVEESFKRRPNRLDYYERDRPKLERISKMYKILFEAHDDEGWYSINGIGNVDDVHSRIVKLVEPWLKAR